MTNFKKELETFVNDIKTDPNIKVLEFKLFEPVSDEEIENTEKRLNIKIDQDLLKYFKESNGYRLHYKIKSLDEDDLNAYGALLIPSLADLFSEHDDNSNINPTEYFLEIFGGVDEYFLRDQMYLFDKFNAYYDESIYYATYYVLDHNVLLFSTDYSAAISDANPITIDTYMEMCLKTKFLMSARNELLNNGYSSNWPTISNINELDIQI